MSQIQSENLLKDLSSQLTTFQAERNAWSKRVFDYEFETASRMNYSLQTMSEDDQRTALEAAHDKALEQAGPEPRVGTDVLTLRDNVMDIIRADILESGTKEAPDLIKLYGENPAFINITGVATRPITDALIERMKNGQQSLAGVLGDVNATLSDKGYDLPLMESIKKQLKDQHVPTVPETAEAAIVARALTDGDLRKTIVSELDTSPPTPTSIENAAVLLRHPDVVKDLPATYSDGLWGGTADWMEKAAKLAPEVALENQAKLKQNGFENAVDAAQKAQHGSLIQYSPQQQHAEAQILPDARGAKALGISKA